MKFLAITCLLALFSRSFGQSVICDDYDECDSDTISTGYLYCYGYYGCDSADVTASYTYAYGGYGAVYADLTTSYLYAYGFRAAYAAEIVSYYVYAYGYQALLYSDLESRGSVLYIYAYGYYGAYYSDMYCYSGDSCRIYCGGSYGCYYTKFYCYSGATCYYDCSTDEICPTLYSGVGTTVEYEGEIKGKHYEGMSDDEIKAKKIENKHIKRKMMANKENEAAFEGEDDAAYKARMDGIDGNLLAIDGHSPSIINGAKLSYGNKMVIGGAAVSVAFVVGALLGKYKTSQYEKI